MHKTIKTSETDLEAGRLRQLNQNSKEVVIFPSQFETICQLATQICLYKFSNSTVLFRCSCHLLIELPYRGVFASDGLSRLMAN
jgi:hypothetical protein